MTAPAPSRLIHGPWLLEDDLPTDRPALGDGVWAELTWRASELLYLLSGRQWAGSRESTVVLEAPHPREIGAPGLSWRETFVSALAPSSMLQPSSGLRPAAGGAVVAGSRWPVRPVREGGVVVVLPGPPVTQVTEVVVDGNPFAEWIAWVPQGHLERTDGRRWELDGLTAVTFQHGAGPPRGGIDAALELTLELGRARAGDGNCRLPKRVTNLQREGVTVSLLDPGEHLDKARTGLLNVDAWLMSVNPHRIARRASAWSPDQIRTRRVSTP